MIAYTTFISKDHNIELTGFLHRESSVEPFRYSDISIKFKDEYGQELEYWDNRSWICEFINHLHESRWAVLSEMLDAHPDKKVDIDYIIQYSVDILQLWNAAKELKIV